MFYQEQDFLDHCRMVIDDGEWVVNERTGKRCRTYIGARFVYDASQGFLPAQTTKTAYWKSAIAEMIGYWRGYDSAAQFRAIGCKTWDANANETKAWLENKFRKGRDDIGRAYGVQLRCWRNPEGEKIDQLRKVYDHLRAGIDDRGEILTFWNPGEHDRACLRSCMHTHTFSLLGGKLFLHSDQRSADLPLGVGFNSIQVVWNLMIMAQITGHEPAKAFHSLVNTHIYADQIDLMENVQLQREPLAMPKLVINPEIKTLEDIETWVTVDDFELVGYEHHPAIKYPFSE